MTSDILTFRAKILPGPKLDKWSRGKIAAFLDRFIGEELEVSIRKRRSSTASAYYRAAVVKTIWRAFRETSAWDGSEEDIHIWLVYRHLGTQVKVDPDGVERIERVETKNLSSAEFHAYVDAIIADERIGVALTAAGLHIETPEEYKRRTGQKIRGGAIYEEAA
jgi:hypothetical protein